MKHRIVTVAQMKAIEQAGNAHGLPYLQMMESAGLTAYAELKNVLPQPGSLLVVCGKGNNGGDGFVIARAAAKEGWKMGGGHPARYLESVARLRQLRQMPVTELLSYKTVPSVQAWISCSGYLRGGDGSFYQSFVIHRPGAIGSFFQEMA